MVAKSTTQDDARTHSHGHGTANLGFCVLPKDTLTCSLRRHPSPASTSSSNYGGNLNSGYLAKCVRVENIIKAKTWPALLVCTALMWQQISMKHTGEWKDSRTSFTSGKMWCKKWHWLKMFDIFFLFIVTSEAADNNQYRHKPCHTPGHQNLTKSNKYPLWSSKPWKIAVSLFVLSCKEFLESIFFQPK